MRLIRAIINLGNQNRSKYLRFMEGGFDFLDQDPILRVDILKFLLFVIQLSGFSIT